MTQDARFGDETEVTVDDFARGPPDSFPEGPRAQLCIVGLEKHPESVPDQLLSTEYRFPQVRGVPIRSSLSQESPAAQFHFLSSHCPLPVSVFESSTSSRAVSPSVTGGLVVADICPASFVQKFAQNSGLLMGAGDAKDGLGEHARKGGMWQRAWDWNFGGAELFPPASDGGMFQTALRFQDAVLLDACALDHLIQSRGIPLVITIVILVL